VCVCVYLLVVLSLVSLPVERGRGLVGVFDKFDKFDKFDNSWDS